MDQKKLGLALLLAILVLAALLRLPGMDRAYYGDESQWYNAVRFLAGKAPELANKGLDNPQGAKLIWVPLYLLGLENMRYVSLVFGLLTIALVWKMAKDFLDARTALFAALLMALSAYHVLMSQQFDRDGSLITFFIVLSLYAYFKQRRSANKNSWPPFSVASLASPASLVSLASFVYAALLRTTMAALALPIGAYAYFEKEGRGRLRHAAKQVAIYALAFFFLALPLWVLVDSLFGHQYTFSSTITHYGEALVGYSLTPQQWALRLAVAVARLVARVDVAMTLALALAAYHIGRVQWKKLASEKRAVYASFMAWLLFVVGVALIATRGDPPRYFSVSIPFIALLVASVIKDVRKVGAREAGLAVLLGATYLGSLAYMNFNEINLLLLPLNGGIVLVLAGAFWLAVKDMRKLCAFLALLSVITSMFMLTGFRTYDAIRSESVSDAAAYLNSVGAARIAESQELALGLYVNGTVQQYEEVPHPVPAGYYVVDFPLKPKDLTFDVGTEFRFNRFDTAGVAGCEKVRVFELHEIIVSEFYKCG